LPTVEGGPFCKLPPIGQGLDIAVARGSATDRRLTQASGQAVKVKVSEGKRPIVGKKGADPRGIGPS